MHRYTPEELQFIKSQFRGRSPAELAGVFNRHFGLRGKKKLTPGQIKGVSSNHKLRNGRDCRFRPGNIPFNKGMTGIHFSRRTEFKPGNRPQNWQPVGTEIIDGYGYMKVKTRNPGTWKFKHRLVWEKARGRIPKGGVILFADGDKSNFGLDNLILISRQELAVMNRRGLIHANGNLTKTGKSIADLKIAIAEAKKNQKKGANRLWARKST
ncbi:MAG: HNH endonuclease [Spirochaetia bacterium]|jgi:hypothetical protein|nr:HNH endonuclease [Spirochaetia bacterium]